MKKSITLALAAALLASPAMAYDPLTPNQLVDMMAFTFVHGELCNRPFEKALNKQLSQGLVNELNSCQRQPERPGLEGRLLGGNRERAAQGRQVQGRVVRQAQRDDHVGQELG